MVTDLESVEVDEGLLSAAELGRALSIASSPQLRPYLAACTWARKRLATYLVTQPSEIVFAADQRGMPVVAAPDTDLRFSLSYSGSVGVMALGFGRDVGVEIEAIEAAGTGQIPAAAGENEPAGAEPADRVGAYLRSLVREAALTKAKGVGVDEILTMSDLEASSPVVVGGFEITDIPLGNDLVAAVAVPVETTIHLIVDDTASKLMEPAAAV
jgi:phosphopantetheinyl transferase